MATNYVITAPAVQLKTTSGQYETLYAGTPIPENADPKQLKRLVKDGFVEKVETPEPEADKAPKVASIPDILKEVGDDQAKAAAALEAEQARGDDARPTLVSKLEAILAPSGS